MNDQTFFVLFDMRSLSKGLKFAEGLEPHVAPILSIESHKDMESIMVGEAFRYFPLLAMLRCMWAKLALPDCGSNL
jgi:hypothetical protein